jgi:steroid delta-isomerase
MTQTPITMSATASRDDAAFIYEQWDSRTRAHDIDGVLDLYLPDAVLESPLVSRIMDGSNGVLTGHDQIRPFFVRGTEGRPTDIVRFYRTGRYHFDGQTLIWEYPRHTPDGDQLDLVEVMDLQGPKITHHRIYWGWFGTPILTRTPR